jgi:hypothetical protein
MRVELGKSLTISAKPDEVGGRVSGGMANNLDC